MKKTKRNKYTKFIEKFGEDDPECLFLSRFDEKITNFRVSEKYWNKFVDRCERNKASFTLKRLIWAYIRTFKAGFSRDEFNNNKWVLITQSDYEKYIPPKSNLKEDNKEDPFNGL